jgi:hypothetical protein
VARLLVEIDEELKKDLKVRLIREGVTLKQWVAKMAEAYVDGKVSTPAAATAPARRPLGSTPGGRHDDYLD